MELPSHPPTEGCHGHVAADYKASVCICSLGQQCTVAVYNGVQQRVQLCVSTIQIIGQLCSEVHSVHMVGCKKGGTKSAKMALSPSAVSKSHPPARLSTYPPVPARPPIWPPCLSACL